MYIFLSIFLFLLFSCLFILEWGRISADPVFASGHSNNFPSHVTTSSLAVWSSRASENTSSQECPAVRLLKKTLDFPILWVLFRNSTYAHVRGHDPFLPSLPILLLCDCWNCPVAIRGISIRWYFSSHLLAVGQWLNWLVQSWFT